MSYMYVNRDNLEIQIAFISSILPKVSEDELAMAHIVCPTLFGMYKKLSDKVDSMRSELNFIDDRLEEARQEAAEMMAEYKESRGYYD